MEVIGLKLTGLLALGLCVGPRVEGRADSVLRGFEKIFLKAGETKRVTFEPGDVERTKFSALWLDGRKIGAFESLIAPHRYDWTAEPGDFDLRLGASSTDIRLNKIVTLR